jgi:outer membrane assembly lipoprotein YfiO
MNMVWSVLIVMSLVSLSSYELVARNATKHVSASSKENGPYAQMTYEEVFAIKNAAVEKGNKSVAIATLERLIRLCVDPNQLGDLMLELGCFCFEAGRYAKSAELYNQFVTFYPGADHVEYALYQAINAEFHATRPADRDQTDTEKVIALADTFLGKAHFTEHRQQVIDLRAQAYRKLFDAEVNVCQFYLNRKQYFQLNRRLAYLGGIMEKEKTLKPYLIRYEMELATKHFDNAVLIAKREQLHEQYPEHEELIEQQYKKSNTWYSWLKVWA